MAKKIIHQIKASDGYHHITIPLVSCATAASTAAKVVSDTSLTSSSGIDAGTTILLKLANGNSATSPTLNINSTGAKNIIGSGSCKPSQFSWTNALMRLIYDGTQWMIIG